MVFETGLSDFHKMSVTVMKMYYAKQKPSIVHYRKFKNFCNDSFIKDTELLLSKLCDQQNVPFKILKESVNITLDKHAPLKKRYVRANQSPLMNKKLSKEIMKRSNLRNSHGWETWSTKWKENEKKKWKKEFLWQPWYLGCTW